MKDALADLDSGTRKFLRGDYQAARADLRRVRGVDKQRAELQLVRIEIRLGNYTTAEDMARALAKRNSPKTSLPARVLLGEVLLAIGRYDEARSELEAIAGSGAPSSATSPSVSGTTSGDELTTLLRARYLLGLTYLTLGLETEVAATFERFFADWNANVIDQQNPEQLMYVAEAARYRQAFEDANDVFREAVALAPEFLDANIAWGAFGLDKYAVALAEQSFDEVLKRDPNHPDAHRGMALVKLEQSYDVAAALSHLEKALEINPRHVPSLLARATLEIDRNQWDAARKSIDEVFAVNPNSLEGHSLLATVHWLRDDTAAYEAARDKVFAINPRYAELFHIVARSAVREHRYRAAIALEEQAVKMNPKYYEAMQALGTGYLRLGQEKEGLEWLRKAWEGDEYNVRTYNTLNLFEEEIPKQYSFARGKSFLYRYPNQEKALLRRYIEPVLEDAFADMVARYKFRPQTPVIIELFHDPQHYSVRTVGLPNLGALGVCFGQVITAMSPSVGEINWGMVLWHELAHIFAIQMSRSRVPRWYTEGLSEYETLRARPEWRRENDADLAAAVANGTLPSVAELNHSFMQPNPQGVITAYYQSAVTIEYIVETHGFEQVVAGLRLFADGHETAAVIEAITGQSVADFDRAFRRYLEARLAPYQDVFRIPTTGVDDVTALAIAADARPSDADAQAKLALGHFFDGNAEAAQAAADKALAIDESNTIALYIAAELAVRQRDVAGARARYRTLIAAGGDNYDVRTRLSLLAQMQGDTDEAIAQLCAAKALDPERSYPYLKLAEIYREVGRTEEALHELETYVMLEQMQYGPLKELVTSYATAQNWPKVRDFGQMAVFIQPFDGEMLTTLATAYLETGDLDKALFNFDSALMSQPEIRRPALAHLGRARALLGKGQKRQAREALRRALAIEPENAQALELRKRMATK